ncbi:MAG: HDOD domain-containing protein [Phycisphaerales bacterium]|nr:HDOD domain-containing protein [Phycisphaerales bacterium]
MAGAQMTLDTEQVIRLALARIGDIATLPEVTAKIISIVDDPKSTAHDLHHIIKNDPALATKILKVVNSAFYGLPGQVSDLDRAIVLLGLSAVKNIAISASISRLFTTEKISDKFNARDIWKHSVAVGVVTREFCCRIGKKAFAEEAFLAGLIHDLGLLIERQAFPEQLSDVIRSICKNNRPICEVEMEMLGADHQSLGSALAAKWKFPRPLQAVLGYHHRIESLAEDQRLLPTLVYIADTLACHERIGFYLTGDEQDVDDVLLETVGLSEADFGEVREQLPEYIQSAESMLSD